MRTLVFGILTLMLVGCYARDRTPPPEPARVPGPQERRVVAEPTQKPLPGEVAEIPPPPFNDTPLLSQEAPETQRFVDAYNRIGHPRFLVWVVSQPQGYDEAGAHSIDYAAMQAILTDWLACGGRVAVISQEAARQSLSPQQAGDLDSGHGVNGKEVSDRIRADILVSVRAEVTRQSGSGPVVRLIAEASNLSGGESIGRAVVDVPPPLDKPQINSYTRFVARKLMQDMSSAWASFGAPPATAPH